MEIIKDYKKQNRLKIIVKKIKLTLFFPRKMIELGNIFEELVLRAQKELEVVATMRCRL